jgi:serine/threonine protein kinase
MLHEAREALGPPASAPLARGCLDDLEAFAVVGGTVAPDRLAEIVGHADVCVACRELIEGLCAADPVRATDDVQSADPLLGLEIAGGTYRIGPLLATGGMGRVYRATDLALGRDVAIKVPRSQTRWLVRRFEREVAITARLDHPGVVPIHGAGRLPDGTPFYVMRILDGVPLDAALGRAINREQRLALLGHLVAVANTMAYVHAEGVAHRDLKPQNVVLGRFGETLIIDWGLAKHLDASAPGAPAGAPAIADDPAADSVERVLAGRTTRPGDVLGTPAFMSPEQARGEDVDQRSDVYAVGAMLEQLLTGRLPRKAADAALAQAPPELVAIVRRAMAPDREARYADCGALAIELRAATGHRPSLVTSPAPARSTRWPIVLAAAGGLAVGLAIAQLGWL